MEIDVCFSPVLYPFYSEREKDSIVVVVDIFRASTTMCAALANGAQSIITVASTEEAVQYKKQGYLVGAERNVKRCDFADFGNSPFDYTPEKVEGKTIVFTTTNGTQAIEKASDCYKLVVGAFSNISAIVGLCAAEKKDVIVLCAGWNNKFNIEDSLYGGVLVDRLFRYGFTCGSDAAVVAKDMWKEAQNDVRKYIDRAEHIKRLDVNGLQDSVDYCLTEDTVSFVPVFDKRKKSFTLL